MARDSGLNTAAPRRVRFTLSAAAGCLALFAASPAWAHGAKNLGDFYAGLAQPIYHPESLLLLLAVGLWAGQLAAESRLEAPLAFAGGVLAGATVGLLGVSLPGTLGLVRCGALGLGALVAARWHPPVIGMLLVGAVMGVAQGHFGAYSDRGEVARPLLFVAGLGLGPLIVVGWFVALFDRFRAPWIQIALRVAGSWIATISLLVSVLALTRGSA